MEWFKHSTLGAFSRKDWWTAYREASFPPRQKEKRHWEGKKPREWRYLHPSSEENIKIFQQTSNITQWHQIQDTKRHHNVYDAIKLTESIRTGLSGYYKVSSPVWLNYTQLNPSSKCHPASQALAPLASPLHRCSMVPQTGQNGTPTS